MPSILKPRVLSLNNQISAGMGMMKGKKGETG